MEKEINMIVGIIIGGLATYGAVLTALIIGCARSDIKREEKIKNLERELVLTQKMLTEAQAAAESDRITKAAITRTKDSLT